MLAVGTIVHAQHLSGGEFNVSTYPKYVQKWLKDWHNLKIKVWKLQIDGERNRFLGRVTCKHTY
jgi:hypothetical protein